MDMGSYSLDRYMDFGYGSDTNQNTRCQNLTKRPVRLSSVRLRLSSDAMRFSSVSMMHVLFFVGSNKL